MGGKLYEDFILKKVLVYYKTYRFQNIQTTKKSVFPIFNRGQIKIILKCILVFDDFTFINTILNALVILQYLGSYYRCLFIFPNRKSTSNVFLIGKTSKSDSVKSVHFPKCLGLSGA